MKNIKKDFKSFVDDAGTAAGSSFILQKVQADIAKSLPRRSSVAMKLGAIHLVSSFVTLMACPQFGLRLFFSGDGLMDLFMKISPTFCQSFCGAFYLAATILLARLVLKYDEWLVIVRSRSLTIAGLSLVSLGIFAMLNREVSIETGILWLVGAAFAGELATLSKNGFQKFLVFRK